MIFMEQQPAWQRHLLLIIGIGLPFALMMFVLGYRALVTASVELPRYAPVYAVIDPDNTYPAGSFDTAVDNSLLTITYVPPTGTVNETRTATPKIRVYILHDTIRGPETFDVVGDIKQTVKTKITLPMALQARMIPGNAAPDGYNYIYNYDGYNGLFTDLFVGGGRNYQDVHAIAKNGRIISLLPNNLRWANFRFLGWLETPVHP
jgi:hypothetical protein